MKRSIIALATAMLGLCMQPAVAHAQDINDTEWRDRAFPAMMAMTANTCEDFHNVARGFGLHTELDWLRALSGMTSPMMTNSPGDPFAQMYALGFATVQSARAVGCGAVAPTPFAPVFGSSEFFHP